MNLKGSRGTQEELKRGAGKHPANQNLTHFIPRFNWGKHLPASEHLRHECPLLRSECGMPLTGSCIRARGPQLEVPF